MHSSNLSALSSSNRKNYKANSHYNNGNTTNKNASLNDITYNISSHIPQPTNYQYIQQQQQQQTSPRQLLSPPVSNASNVKHPVAYSTLPHGVLINNNHHFLQGNSGSAPSIDIMSSMISNKGK